MYPLQRFCLIGGSGFIGTYLAERLIRAGKRVTIPTRQFERAKRRVLSLPQLELAEVNIGDADALAALLRGHDAVVNLVGILHGSRQDFERAHVGLTGTILRACQLAGVRRYGHISAIGAAPDAASDYQRSKAQAEALVRDSGLDWTLFRPSVVFGREDHFLNLFACLQRYLPLLPLAGADTRFQPVWVDDVARAIVAALACDAAVGKTLELVGPDILTLRELVKKVGRWSGHPRPVIGLPTGLALLQAGLMECLPGQPLMSRDNVRSLATDNVGSQGFPSGLLGFAPSSLNAIAPGWLAGGDSAFDRLRAGARR